jgi:hypothetical protein
MSGTRLVNVLIIMHHAVVSEVALPGLDRAQEAIIEAFYVRAFQHHTIV